MSRETVLELLRDGAGDFLSGEELSRRLGLSRAAIWKAVDALRKEGYVIEARTGLGYRLTAVPDAMSEAEIRSFLGRTAVVVSHRIGVARRCDKILVIDHQRAAEFGTHAELMEHQGPYRKMVELQASLYQ